MINDQANESENILKLRDIKHKLVELHKELRYMKGISYRENPYYRALREVKNTHTKVQEAIAWCDNALFELKNANERTYPPTE